MRPASAVFLLGVVGLDTVHAAVKPGPSSATLWAAAEEGCEFVGVTLLIWAALRLVRHRAPMMVRRTTAA